MRRTMCSLQKPKSDSTDMHIRATTSQKKSKKIKEVKSEMEHYRLEWQSARDCAGPLSHCLLLPEKEKGRRGGRGGGEKWLTVKNKSDTLKFPSFLLFTIEIFFPRLETLGFQRRFQQLSTAQPVVWDPHKPFICMSFGNKANNHPRK